MSRGGETLYQNPYLSATPAAMGYQPYGMQQQQQQQPIHGFVYVTGLEGAKAFQMPPNSEMPLFDSTTDDRMFIKTTDGAGFPTIKVAHCSFEESQPDTRVEYASVDDLNALRNEVENLRTAIYEGVSHGKHVSQATD